MTKQSESNKAEKGEGGIVPDSKTTTIDAQFESVAGEKGDETEVFEIEIIDPYDVIVPDAKPVYTGSVVSVHGGFSYIGHVRRGYESIATNGDVFVPLELEAERLVEFSELNSDPKREGKFRTEMATYIEDALVPQGEISKAVALRELSQRHVYHADAKSIDPELAEKASENHPFNEILLRKIAEGGDVNLIAMAESFLRGTYASLIPIGVSYNIAGEIDLSAERAKVEAVKAKYQQSNLTGMVQSIRDEYEGFVGMRDVFNLMNANGILTVESVLPVHYLPDMLVMSPVWFVHSKTSLLCNELEEDPLPDHAVKFFSDQVGTMEFAWFYQIYNRRTRPLSAFSGRDIIPPAIMEVMEQAKQTFDYLVIATPYHDIASREWVDPNWQRNIDPFLIGFKKGMPFMFLLGRWSGTGLFPLMCDMIADTMNHLRINREKLRNFRNPYWYTPLNNDTHSSTNGDNLATFASEALKAYAKGELFDFLRGGKKVSVKKD